MSNMNFDQMVDRQETATPARRGLELRKRPEVFVVGGLPTVSLLPRELKAAARDKSIRRGLIGLVVVAVVIAGGATAGATALSGAAQSKLDAANAQTQTLVGQLAKFRDVQVLQQGVNLGKAAVTVGTSTNVDWQAQIDSIEADMPSGYTVTSILADSASPIAAYAEGLTPIEQPRAASVSMTVTSSSITELPIWLRKLRSIPAYADASASVSSGSGAAYTVNLTIHLSSKALVNAKGVK